MKQTSTAATHPESPPTAAAYVVLSSREPLVPKNISQLGRLYAGQLALLSLPPPLHFFKFKGWARVPSTPNPSKLTSFANTLIRILQEGSHEMRTTSSKPSDLHEVPFVSKAAKSCSKRKDRVEGAVKFRCIKTA